MEIPRLRREPTKQRTVVDELPCDEMHDFVFALDHALDTHQSRAEQLAALAIAEVAPHHHIDIASFILERDEHDARRSIGTLTAGDDATGTRAAAVGEGTDLGGGGELHPFQALPKQCQWMPAEREAETCVISYKILALSGQPQRRWRFEDGSFAEEMRPRLDAGDVPVGAPAVFGERVERAGGSEALEVVCVEARAAADVFD